MTIYLIQLLFGVTLLTVISLVFCRLLKKRSASSRHAILAATLLGTLLLPLLLPLLPRWSVVTLPVLDAVDAVTISEPITFVCDYKLLLRHFLKYVKIGADRQFSCFCVNLNHFTEGLCRYGLRNNRAGC